MKKEMVRDLWMVLGGLYFCWQAAKGFMRLDTEIKEEYKKLPGRNVWQRKKAWSELVIGMGAILFYMLDQYKVAVLILSAIVISAFFYRCKNNEKFVKGMYKESGR